MSGIEAGHYYRKQVACPSGVIAWSHRARYAAGLRLLGAEAGRLLDYGCGDGTFLAMAAARVREGVGADVAPDQVADCRERLASFGNLRFCEVDELAAPEHAGAFDVVMCMETLEHCVPAVVEKVLGDLRRLVAPAGRVIISVPVETGLPFVLKAVLRRAAALRGLSDYRHYERYVPRDAWRMIVAGAATVVDRPVYGDPAAPYHSHYGFNWRALRASVASRFVLERTTFSPLAATGSLLASQAWFVCRPDRAVRGR